MIINLNHNSNSNCSLQTITINLISKVYVSLHLKYFYDYKIFYLILDIFELPYGGGYV